MRGIVAILVPPVLLRGSMRKLLLCLCLATLTLGFYFPAWHLDFVNYDDQGYVYENPHVLGGLTPQSVAWAFRTTDLANYHPITWLSFELDVSLFGARPGAIHLENVLIHFLNTVLLFLILGRATGDLQPSLVAAAIFAVHPVHVESVAWISERKDVLSGLFFLLGIAAYLRFVSKKERGGRWAAYLAVVVCFSLGLLAKPMIVTFPFVLLLLDYWPLRRIGFGEAVKRPRGAGLAVQPISRKKAVLEKIPLFGLAGVSSAITMQVQKSGGAMMDPQKLPLANRAANAAVSYARYLGKIIWPARLSIFYPHPLSWPALVVVGSIVLLIAITIVCIRSARRLPYLIVGWLLFLGTLVPVIGLVQVGWQSIADRYLYLPLIGPVIMLAWGGQSLVCTALACTN